MDFGRLLKWAVVIAVIVVVWKVAVPKLREMRSDGGTSGAVTQGSCPSSAARASSTWGAGLGQFVNPPYDLDRWSALHASVEAQILVAETDCGCPDPSCEKTHAALHDLRTLMSEFDTAIRNGSPPPSDAVQRQESIDRRIDEAAELVRAGK
jgi:hypothetical protein